MPWSNLLRSIEGTRQVLYVTIIIITTTVTTILSVDIRVYCIQPYSNDSGSSPLQLCQSVAAHRQAQIQTNFTKPVTAAMTLVHLISSLV